MDSCLRFFNIKWHVFLTRLSVLSLGRWWAGNDVRVYKSGFNVEDGLVYGEPKVCKNNYQFVITRPNLIQKPTVCLVVLACYSMLSSVDCFFQPK